MTATVVGPPPSSLLGGGIKLIIAMKSLEETWTELHAQPMLLQSLKVS